MMDNNIFEFEKCLEVDDNFEDFEMLNGMP